MTSLSNSSPVIVSLPDGRCMLSKRCQRANESTFTSKLGLMTTIRKQNCNHLSMKNIFKTQMANKKKAKANQKCDEDKVDRLLDLSKTRPGAISTSCFTTTKLQSMQLQNQKVLVATLHPISPSSDLINLISRN